jgi:hypothetical protein
LSETKNPLKTFNGQLNNIRERIESKAPMGTIRIVKLDGLYKLDVYQLERLGYTISAGNGVAVDMTGGKLRPDVAETLAYLNYRIDQQVDV